MDYCKTVNLCESEARWWQVTHACIKLCQGFHCHPEYRDIVRHMAGGSQAHCLTSTKHSSIITFSLMWTQWRGNMYRSSSRTVRHVSTYSSPYLSSSSLGVRDQHISDQIITSISAPDLNQHVFIWRYIGIKSKQAHPQTVINISMSC